ncbi:DUF1365 domain-containing protein [Nitrosomonadales bacterium]|nr:DUF1365 domain-containing protein [Nitrosomonadales bacterium]
MHSIYKGTISHTRHLPKKHQFKYSICMLYVDLEQIETAFDKNFFWSYNKMNLASFNEADYYKIGNQKVFTSIKKLIKKRINTKVDGKIYLLTNAKYFGYCFNPVSFYYCFNKLNKLIVIVSHITNTPWNEKYAYVHDCRNIKNGAKKFKLDKEFHVSPFMPMDINYKWTFTEPKDFLYVSMDNYQKNEFNFNATLKLTKKAWTPWALNRLLLKFPPSSLKTIFTIYWNAFILLIKKIPFYPHP